MYKVIFNSQNSAWASVHAEEETVVRAESFVEALALKAQAYTQKGERAYILRAKPPVGSVLKPATTTKVGVWQLIFDGVEL